MSSATPATESAQTIEAIHSSGVSPSFVGQQDRRLGPRCEGGYWASLLSLDGEEVIRCRPDNMGEGGLHFTAPVGYGFAVGQRYELLVGEADESGAERSVVGEGHYATVVRTKFLMAESSDQVGVGLRFDQPLVL
jgi:hypothetical protein